MSFCVIIGCVKSGHSFRKFVSISFFKVALFSPLNEWNADISGIYSYCGCLCQFVQTPLWTQSQCCGGVSCRPGAPA